MKQAGGKMRDIIYVISYMSHRRSDEGRHEEIGGLMSRGRMEDGRNQLTPISEGKVPQQWPRKEVPHTPGRGEVHDGMHPVRGRMSHTVSVSPLVYLTRESD